MDQEPPASNIGTAPVSEGRRIDALDAARGFALAGILCVNILLFANPFGTYGLVDPSWPLTDRVLSTVVHALCTGKFYGLFSLLFGIGFALQRERVKATGRPWVGVYLRRLIMLGVLGVLHATLLWYGDILFIYAGAALVLLACGRLSARALMTTGACLVLIGVLLGTGVAALEVLSRPQTPPSAPVQPEAGAPVNSPPESIEPPFRRLMKELKERRVDNPQDPLWRALETEAYREGPYRQLLAFRLLSWAMLLLIAMLTFGWNVLGMFMLGAGLVKAGLFDAAKSHWHMRAAVAGALVGLPLCAAGAIGRELSPGGWMLVGDTLLQGIGSPLMSLGYLGAITWLVRSGKCRWLMERLMTAGRLALTHYLTQSLVATSIFYFYGLAWFGRTSRAEELAIAAAIYLTQVFIIGPVWLKFFRSGPMEWLWRSFTYLRWQPLMRATA